MPPQIGRYQIKSELGRGGMAIVYRAYDPHFERDVAVKVMPREFMFDEGFRTRFEREAKAIAALEHSAIVPVYDYGEEQGQPYIVMRYMPGGSLSERLQRGPLTYGETVRIAERVAAALDRAHQQGVIHRDVKPANIMFDDVGDAYLSDFGIVKLTESTAHLTGSAIVGTPAYMAPEMASPGGVTTLVDVYALGATIYQMLTGNLPFAADTPMGLIAAHISQPVPDIRAERPDLPPSVQTVIERALAKDPAHRYPSAGTLAVDLRSARDVARVGAGTGTATGSVTYAETLVEPPTGATRYETGATILPSGTWGTAGAPATGVPRPAARQRGGLPRWAWIGGAVVGAAALGVAVLIGLLALAGVFGSRAVATPEATLFVLPMEQTSTALAAAVRLTPATREPGSAMSAATATTPPAATSAPTRTPPAATAAPTSIPPTSTLPPTLTTTPTLTATPTLTFTPTVTAWSGATGLRVTGQVLWGTTPISGARIEIKESGNYYYMPVLVSTTTDAGGNFTLDNPPAGDLQIYAVSPSEDYWSWVGRSITIPPGGTVNAGTFYLSKKLVLLEPGDGTTVATTTPTLRWQSFPAATRYHVDVFNDITGVAVLRQDTTDTSLVTTPLTAGVTYQWSVNAYDAAGVQIAYYSAWRFTVQP